MSVNKNFLYMMIASQMKGVGVALEGMDADTKGKDDAAGMILDVGSDVVLAFVGSDDAKMVKAMKAINQASGAWLDANAKK
jgi:hypothetical protein